MVINGTTNATDPAVTPHGKTGASHTYKSHKKPAADSTGSAADATDTTAASQTDSIAQTQNRPNLDSLTADSSITDSASAALALQKSTASIFNQSSNALLAQANLLPDKVSQLLQP